MSQNSHSMCGWGIVKWVHSPGLHNQSHYYSQVLPEDVGRNVIVSVVPHELRKARFQAFWGRFLAEFGPFQRAGAWIWAISGYPGPLNGGIWAIFGPLEPDWGLFSGILSLIWPFQRSGPAISGYPGPRFGWFGPLEPVWGLFLGYF